MAKYAMFSFDYMDRSIFMNARVGARESRMDRDE